MSDNTQLLRAIADAAENAKSATRSASTAAGNAVKAAVSAQEASANKLASSTSAAASAASAAAAAAAAASVGADITTTPTADKVPRADGFGKLDPGWLPSASSVVPSLDHFVQLVAPSDTLALTDLQGDLEGEYLIDGVLIGAAVNSNFIQFMINGGAANLVARSGDMLVGSSYRTDWYFANTAQYPLATDAVWSISGRLTAKSGRLRQLQVNAFANDSNHDYLYMAGQITDNAPIITGFSVVCDIADGMVSGSYLRLTPLNSATA